MVTIAFENKSKLPSYCVQYLYFNCQYLKFEICYSVLHPSTTVPSYILQRQSRPTTLRQDTETVPSSNPSQHSPNIKHQYEQETQTALLDWTRYRTTPMLHPTLRPATSTVQSYNQASRTTNTRMIIVNRQAFLLLIFASCPAKINCHCSRRQARLSQNSCQKNFLLLPYSPVPLYLLFNPQ